MRDLFSQMYVRTYVSVMLRNVNFTLTVLHSRARSETHTSRALTMEVEDREGRRFLTMEDAEDSTAESSATYMFCGVEC